MTIREMDVFVNVAELSSLTKVSEIMNLTQPSISMSIKSIEKKFNEKMFDRISKKLIINERGRVLYNEIIPLLTKLREFEERFSENKLVGNINIAATNTIGVYILADTFYDYIKKYNDIKINHLYEDVDTILSFIYEGKADIGFIESEITDENIIKELVYKDKLIAVSSDKELSQKSFYIDQLFNREWIIRETYSSVTKTFFEYLGDLKDELNIVLALEHTVAIKKLLKKHKNTISILAEKSVEEELKKGELFKVDINNMKFERNFYMIYHKNKFKNAVFNSFRNFAVENISNTHL